MISNEDSIPIHDIKSKVFQILHGINSTLDNNFALDFLPNTTEVTDKFIFRIIHTDDEIIESILSEVQKNIFINDYCILKNRIRVCPTKCKFIENRRKRIRGHKTKCRERSIEFCKGLLHFKYRSKSTGHRPIIFVQPIEYSTREGNFNPTNYGLSNSSDICIIPHFELDEK